MWLLNRLAVALSSNTLNPPGFYRADIWEAQLNADGHIPAFCGDSASIQHSSYYRFSLCTAFCTSRCTHTHVHAYMCTNAHTYIQTLAYAHMHTNTSRDTHAYAHMHPDECIRTRAYRHMHTDTCKRTHACTHTHTHLQTHTRIHTRAYTHQQAPTRETEYPSQFVPACSLTRRHHCKGGALIPQYRNQKVRQTSLSAISSFQVTKSP